MSKKVSIPKPNPFRQENWPRFKGTDKSRIKINTFLCGLFCHFILPKEEFEVDEMLAWCKDNIGHRALVKIHGLTYWSDGMWDALTCAAFEEIASEEIVDEVEGPSDVMGGDEDRMVFLFLLERDAMAFKLKFR